MYAIDMERPGLHEAVAGLQVKQLRIEHKALLDIMDGNERQYKASHAELMRQIEEMRVQQGELVETMAKNESGFVSERRKWEIWGDRLEKIWEFRNKFFESGLMGEEARAAAAQNSSARGTRRTAATETSKNPPTLREPRTISTQLPPINPFKLPFFDRASYDNGDLPRYQFQHAPPTPQELQNMISRECSQLGEDIDEDEDEDDDLDAFMRFKEAENNAVANRGISRAARHVTIGRYMNTSDATCKIIQDEKDDDENDLEAFMASRNASQRTKKLRGASMSGQYRSRLPRCGTQEEDSESSPQKAGRPSKIVILRANPDIERQSSRSFDDPLSRLIAGLAKSVNSDHRMTERPASLSDEARNMKRPRSMAYEQLPGRRPQTRSSLPEPTVQRKHALAPKVATSKAVSEKAHNSAPKPSKLPRLSQRKQTFSDYFKAANDAFATYEDKSLDGQEAFVNHFLKGIYEANEKEAAVEKLQRLQESTIRNGKPWIICYWRDVLGALVSAKLLTGGEVV